MKVSSTDTVYDWESTSMDWEINKISTDKNLQANRKFLNWNINRLIKYQLKVSLLGGMQATKPQIGGVPDRSNHRATEIAKKKPAPTALLNLDDKVTIKSINLKRKHITMTNLAT